MKLALWEHPGGVLEVQIPNFWQEVRTVNENLHQAITVAFPKPVDQNEIQPYTPKSGDPLLTNFRLLLKKTLIFLQMLSPLG